MLVATPLRFLDRDRASASVLIWMWIGIET
ncbi:hypothetical protein CFIICLFH_4260 [Methylobacterium goesingense]|uniref:Uncharacterized protein n=1 Tax=Methylobacterium goesingense TaxID=243690 RepID=A0ABV2L8V7_9HYPH|nr:hypothetical protein CFIICLFH_4260 [Methylobacterium goesingense]